MTKPITPEEMKAYVDATWEKCQTEVWVETNNQVCAMLRHAHDVLALSSLPPRKKWVGLTAKERSELWWATDMSGMPEHDYGKAIEAKLKEKNA